MNPTGTPQSIPGYQIVGKLGAGGMGLVFKAWDLKARRWVALKILYPKTVQNQVLLARFIREAKLLVKFQHPNIVKGYAAGIFQGLYWLAMEYVEGESVQQIIDRQGGLPEDLAINLILQVARALDYLEKQGIIHRDIKPANLLLARRGGVTPPLLKLCDLGFAQPIGQGKTISETTSGTPQYMSPEQAKGQVDVDIRSDIYSLGATFYHILTGNPPFTGTDNLEIMAKQVLADLQSDQIKNRRFMPLTLYFIEKMMAKEKDIRYQNPSAVIEDIESKLAGFKSLEYHPEDIPPKKPYHRV